MFGRGKTAATTEVAPQTEIKQAGKGRPTPRRRTVEQANRRPLVGAPRAVAGTKEERKAARRAQQQAARSERLATRAALQSGDERHLPARDQGPARRFVRDYVDARRNVGEYFLFAALISIVMSMIRLPLITLLSMVLLYGTVLVLGIDTLLLRRQVQKKVTAKFGAAQAAGTGTYAMMRAVQLRRARLPRPQVARGQYPS